MRLCIRGWRQKFIGNLRSGRRDGVRDAAFVEAALLVEAGYQKNLDGLVVAWCRPEQQVERLLARGLSEVEARRRIAAQMPAEEKLKYATEKIDCSGSKEATRRQVEELAAKLRRGQRAGATSRAKTRKRRAKSGSEDPADYAEKCVCYL